MRSTRRLVLKSVVGLGVLAWGVMFLGANVGFAADEVASNFAAARPAGLGVWVVDAADGVQVTGVMPGSPAEQAALRAGDIIRQVDDQPITTTGALAALIRGLRSGDQVALSIDRNGEAQNLNVLLAAWDSLHKVAPHVAMKPTAERTFSVGLEGRRATAGQAVAGDPTGEAQLRALEARTAGLQQQIEQLRANQNARLNLRQIMLDPNWGWNGRGAFDADPALFQ